MKPKMHEWLTLILVVFAALLLGWWWSTAGDESIMRFGIKVSINVNQRGEQK